MSRRNINIEEVENGFVVRHRWWPEMESRPSWQEYKEVATSNLELLKMVLEFLGEGPEVDLVKVLKWYIDEAKEIENRRNGEAVDSLG